ncbi:uncharacterized protein DUF4064 [Scopulibacillus darangshiensis]|uniref:Uncharacterized protein DUF4064 n=1 Tax=Scopulibacillus darangshiensis TaxID=442528 RepID=A0A4V2SKL2_9BACL|nr:DUF4064 domain-containing protein [Scopulibacillus darangshiensis]TCP19946.1 uncharacterized protein DUF4064 [Scopulibacillus darangshiensis]
MKRNTEFVLGLLGGIFGFIAAVFALFMGSIDEAINGSSSLGSLGVSAILASIVAIVGSVVVKFKPKVGGIIMLVAGIWGIISVSFFYILSTVLLVIAGLMGLLVKNKNAKKSNKTIEV